jgi:hypothetical protein
MGDLDVYTYAFFFRSIKLFVVVSNRLAVETSIFHSHQCARENSDRIDRSIDESERLNVHFLSAHRQDRLDL